MGLNSFKETQTIDFEALTQHGLFGVFGPTGSGKSSILDAMTLALYGKTSRDSSNFINIQNDRMQIAFEFKVSDQHYEIIRTFKRNKQGSINATKPTRISEKQSGEWLVLEEATTELNRQCKNIIGLEFKDFIRTVVLPQGKFSEFIQLKGKDRREMLERLFALSKYGDELSKKLSKYIRAEKDNEIHISGQLKGYEDVSNEHLKVLKEQYDLIHKEVKELLVQLKAITDDLQHQEKTMEMKVDYNKALLSFDELKAKEQLIKQKKAALLIGENILKVVPKYQEVESLSSQHEALHEKTEGIKKQYDELMLYHDKTSEAFITVDESYQAFMKTYEVVLHQLNDALAKSKVLKALTVALAEDEITHQHLIENLNSEQDKLNELSVQGKDLNEQLTKSLSLQNELYVSSDHQKFIDESAEKEVAYNRAVKEKEAILVALKGLDVEGLEDEKSSLEALVTGLEEGIKASSIASTEQYFNDKQVLETSLAKLKEFISQLNKTEVELRTVKETLVETEVCLAKENTVFEAYEKSKEHMWLSKIKSQLHEGDDCPVCGHEVHELVKEAVTFEEQPELEENIQKLHVKLMTLKHEQSRLEQQKENMIHEVGDQEEQVIQKQLLELNNAYELFSEKQLHLQNAKKQLDNKSQQLLLAKEQAETKKETLELLDQVIEDEAFLALKSKHGVSFVEEKQKMFAQVKAYEEGKEKTEVIQNELSGIDKQLDEKKALINKYETEIKLSQSSLNVKKEQISELKDALEDKDYESLLNQHQRNYESKKASYDQLKMKLDELNKEKDVLKAALSEMSGQLISTHQHLKTSQEKLEDLLIKYQLKFEDVAETSWTEEKYLSEKDFIESYESSYQKLTSRLEALKERIDEKVTSETCEIVREQHGAMTEAYNTAHKKYIEVQKDIKTIETKLSEMATLIEKRDKILYKLSLLKDLDSLFKGKKFVEYVASYHLRYISVEASNRLFDITSGKYGLEVDDDGMFLVRDYSHGGQTRDMSTLSGGESFLVSLALALSLSSQIQLKGNAPLELFFLDEGFGTLDDQFLELVMTSLEQIHHDKLSIGLISHVDSIKNRVPIKLAVEPSLPGVKGTQVKVERT